MFNSDNKKILYRLVTVATILFGLLTGGIAVSQNDVNASHVRHARTKRMVRRSKRGQRNKVQRRRTRATHRVKQTKRNRKVRRMIKRTIRRKSRGRKKMTKAHKEIRPMKIERRSTSKDPVSVTPEDQD